MTARATIIIAFFLIGGVALVSYHYNRPGHDRGNGSMDFSGNENVSLEIMEDIYGAEYAEIDDVEYQKLRELYLAFSDKLNTSIRNDPEKMAVLSKISKSLFTKRNTVSFEKPIANYLVEQARSLRLEASTFFPEIEVFLKNLGVTCEPDKFDKAVIQKLDFYTQASYVITPTKYFEIEGFFLQIENCSTPLDLLFHGLFHARANRNIEQRVSRYRHTPWYRRLSGRSQIEKDLEKSYAIMLSIQPTGMTEAQIQHMVKEAIKGCKRDAKKEGTAKLPENYGDLLIQAAESGDPDAKKVVESASREGATHEDIREWWNQHDLQRRMIVWSEDVFLLAKLSELAESMSNPGVSEPHFSEAERDEMVARLWKTVPKYRNDPTDTRFASGDDRPLPHELRGRVGRWQTMMTNKQPERYEEMMKKYSSFNAMVRDEIRKGNL